MKNIRRISWYFWLIVSLSFSIFYLPNRALSQEVEEARRAALVEAAKKEAKLIWYSTMNIKDVHDLLKRFRQKYPFISTVSYKAGAEKMLTKILAEATSKKLKCDPIMITGLEALILQKRGIFAKYASPQRKFFPKELKDPNGYWTDIYLNLNVLGYNTKLVSPSDVPRNYQDLLNPKWQGKMALDVKAFSWFAYTIKMMGEEEGLAYMKKLGEQNIRFYSNRTVLAQMLAAGEAAISPAVYNHRIEDLKARGASLEWLAFEPVAVELHPLAISAYADHPNSAKLFIDFILSREGQEMVASFYRIPSRTDVDPHVPRLKKGLKLMPFNPLIAENFNKYVKLYRKLLMKK